MDGVPLLLVVVRLRVRIFGDALFLATAEGRGPGAEEDVAETSDLRLRHHSDAQHSPHLQLDRELHVDESLDDVHGVCRRRRLRPRACHAAHVGQQLQRLECECEIVAVVSVRRTASPDITSTHAHICCVHVHVCTRSCSYFELASGFSTCPTRPTLARPGRGLAMTLRVHVWHRRRFHVPSTPNIGEAGWRPGHDVGACVRPSV
mmetsp:Transcript_49093/g.158549  ORF Transcript_49093/g.158549 Transcript_49093/m.158549 type:complete len:205 (+) Transcript_49093:426-1040(+)